MHHARAVLARKEVLLRERCAQQRRLDWDKRNNYADRSGLEWTVLDEFKLGSGTEAVIFMGLLRDLSAELASQEDSEPVCQLVAVKQSYNENLYQS